jgi:hypothetical protein
MKGHDTDETVLMVARDLGVSQDEAAEWLQEAVRNGELTPVDENGNPISLQERQSFRIVRDEGGMWTEGHL